jgi:hypothetical protein
MVLDDYRVVNREYRLKEGAGAPYVLTAASCFDQVNRWMRRRYPGNPILHVLEQGDCGQKDLERLAKRHRQVVIPLPKINPQTGDLWIPFQGADLVAGAYRSAANKLGRVTTFEDYGEVFSDLD